MSLELKIKRNLGKFNMDIDIASDAKRIGILGASGCGKSLTLKTIAGIEHFDEGKIVYDGEVMADSSKKLNLKPQQRHLGYMFQNYALFPNMTLLQNVQAGIQKKPKAEKEKIAREMIERFGLEGLESHYPGQLSGGQQQRVAIARIMASDPSMIMLDEPFSALDSNLRERLMLDLDDMLKSYRGTIILVSHNRDEIYQLTDEVWIMAKGKIVKSGETKEVFNNPETLAAARLTGCKNVAKASKLDDHHVLVEGWGLTLRTAEPVPDNLSHIGIRAHNLAPGTAGQDNTFKSERIRVLESPFETNHIIRNTDGDTDSTIWWITPHDIYNEFPEYITIPTSAIMLLHL